MDEARKRVAKGIALLDEKGPKDWRERVDMGRFKWTISGCILGQIFGSFYADEARDLRGGALLHIYGFNGDPGSGSVTCSSVEAAWREALS